MSGRRFSRILQSARYYNALDNYIQWVTNTERRNANRRIGQGEARPESQRLFIVPFGVPLLANQRVPVSAAQPTWTARQAAFAGRTSATVPGNENLIVRIADFRPARAIIRTGVRTQATMATSRVTGMPYGNYGGQSSSIPFGREDGDDTQTGAFTEIRTAILGNNPPAGLRVTLQQEKV